MNNIIIIDELDELLEEAEKKYIEARNNLLSINVAKDSQICYEISKEERDTWKGVILGIKKALAIVKGEQE